MYVTSKRIELEGPGWSGLVNRRTSPLIEMRTHLRKREIVQTYFPPSFKLGVSRSVSSPLRRNLIQGFTIEFNGYEEEDESRKYEQFRQQLKRH